MDRLNVLYLIRCWAFGGSHSILLLLMEHMPKDRYNIICVPYDAHTDGDHQFIAQARARGLDVAPERIPWKSRGNWNRARNTIADLIDRYKIDLVHAHDPQSNTILGIGRQRWSCACVASAYGWWDGLFPFRRFVYQWIERDFALPNLDAVITVSDHMKRRILKGPTRPERIHVIHTGLGIKALESNGSRNEFRASLGIPEDACVVGTVSRVSIEKGHTHLIDAVHHVQGAHPNVYLLIIGDGPVRADLQAQARELGLEHRVVFPGWVQHLPDALAAMDLFAQPSVQQEGLPTAILEAEAAGLPIIASDIGGSRETIEPGVTGVLTPPGDALAIAAAIERLAADPARRREMGDAARRRIETHFSLDRMIQQVDHTYGAALASYRSQ
ncbi:MAG: hypothetical protein AMXMBFR84_09340 [Candidatus Hydrogenedentota bacterium]